MPPRDPSVSSSPALARVECVVVFEDVETVQLPGGGPWITPWHPVRAAGEGGRPQWQFPVKLGPQVRNNMRGRKMEGRGEIEGRKLSVSGPPTPSSSSPLLPR